MNTVATDKERKSAIVSTLERNAAAFKPKITSSAAVRALRVVICLNPPPTPSPAPSPLALPSSTLAQRFAVLCRFRTRQ